MSTSKEQIVDVIYNVVSQGLSDVCMCTCMCTWKHTVREAFNYL